MRARQGDWRGHPTHLNRIVVEVGGIVVGAVDVGDVVLGSVGVAGDARAWRLRVDHRGEAVGVIVGVGERVAHSSPRLA